MDTGCKHDRTTRDAASLCQVEIITKANNPVLLSTASDILISDMVVPQQIGALGCDAEPYVSTNHPTSCLLVDGVSKTDTASNAAILVVAHTKVSRGKGRYTSVKGMLSIPRRL